MSKIAHESHKDWARTEAAADALAEIIGGPEDPSFVEMFQRVLVDGNWAEADAAARARSPEAKPFIVLVTGLNGIRKTTSFHQEWFKEVLKDSLGESYGGDVADLPGGPDSFFRQLDYMIASLANRDFKALYAEEAGVEEYSRLKDGIFARYRMLAEMLGMLLLKAGKAKGLHMALETSGRDIAMFQYVDHLFPEGDGYRKLVVHFTVNDIGFAKGSVDRRMLDEMRRGREVLQLEAADAAAAADDDAKGSTAHRVIAVNSGGPYGSEVLDGVQADSARVWREVTGQGTGTGGAGCEAGRGPFGSWLKACISIEGSEEGPWTARAVLPEDQSLGAPRDFASLS